MKYKILRTAKADDQLQELLFYIAESSGDVDTALSYLDKIERSVSCLSEFPYLGVKPRYSILRKEGYRVLIVEKHLVFYKVNEDKMTVIIYAVVDGRREYKNLL
ncbi:MAG: type II toxin-antitoxin system RelE/ParE family toxin [Eubacterium sp.]|nr:type II toxin-antitoxin system RelE/ParE family toxin [Eubacterium sp.]